MLSHSLKQNVNITDDYFKDRPNNIAKLYAFLLPVLDRGWKEDDVFNLLKFMEENRDKVKNKDLDDVIKIYDLNIQKGKL